MNRVFDVAVIGLGPAGILVAHALVDSPRSTFTTLLVDRAAQIGGAAFATDVNLQNITGFPPQSDFGERTLGSRALADALALESYEALHGYGLPYKPNDPVDRYSYAVDEPTLKGIVAKFCSRMEDDPRIELRLRTTLEDVTPGSLRRWRLTLLCEGGSTQVEADHVVLATGKLDRKSVV